MTAVLILACIALNAYAWKPIPTDRSLNCNSGNGLYTYKTDNCVTLFGTNNLNDCLGQNKCICFTSISQASCQECNLTCPGISPQIPGIVPTVSL